MKEITWLSPCVVLLYMAWCLSVPRVQYGWSALHISAWNDYCDLCSLLLKSGADPNLLSGATSDPVTLDSVSPLCVASERGHVEVCRHLIAAGANVSQSSRIDQCNDVTALHLAAKNGHLEVT